MSTDRRYKLFRVYLLSSGAWFYKVTNLVLLLLPACNSLEVCIRRMTMIGGCSRRSLYGTADFASKDRPKWSADNFTKVNCIVAFAEDSYRPPQSGWIRSYVVIRWHNQAKTPWIFTDRVDVVCQIAGDRLCQTWRSFQREARCDAFEQLIPYLTCNNQVRKLCRSAVKASTSSM